MEKDLRNCANQGDLEYCKPEIVDWYKRVKEYKRFDVENNCRATIEDVAKLIPLCSGCKYYKPDEPIIANK